MKFGKRLAAEAARQWTPHYINYKAIKKAIKDDIRRSDPSGARALQVLLQELKKVSVFYIQRANDIESRIEELSIPDPGDRDVAALAQVRADTSALIKFVALNYLAAVKAIKKRNRHFKAYFGESRPQHNNPQLHQQSGCHQHPHGHQQQQQQQQQQQGFDPVHPLDLLSQEAFFTSNRLARLATRAEVLSLEAAPGGGPGTASEAAAPEARAHPHATATGRPVAVAREALLQDYECPVCLELLCNPVVLTCAHRFCWGCLVAHFAAVRGPRTGSAATPSHQRRGGCAAERCEGKQGQQVDVSCEDGFGRGIDGCLAAARQEALVVLEKIVEGSDSEDSDHYSCPVCRQPQVLNIENLQVDPHLAGFVSGLRDQLASAAHSAGAGAGNNGAGGEGASTDCTAITLAAPPGIAPVCPEHALAAPPLAAGCCACTVIPEALAAHALDADMAVVIESASEGEQEEAWLLPPQGPKHADRLTVLLDLDGTLISSFPPQRAPRLPPGMTAHLVGRGSHINPDGMVVVERPGLTRFLEELSSFAEVVVFTAGVEEYASPIIDAIDPAGACISARIYRQGTTRTPQYQFVKDVHHVGRPLSRTVLVDDTPLSFLHNPSNGVPLVGFQGDPDDRLLGEAVMPLLQMLAKASDVRPLLERRFNMGAWFQTHGYPKSIWTAPAHKRAAPAKAAAVHGLLPVAPVPPRPPRHPLTRQSLRCSAGVQGAAVPGAVQEQKDVLLLCDFDKTITDFDAGERLVGELAPELASLLASLQMPANFVPLTNNILAEMQRRGVCRATLLAALQRMGAELPPASVRMLRRARAHGVDVTLLSDCNEVFIGHVLAGARLEGCVADVITNGAAFEPVATRPDDAVGIGTAGLLSHQLPWHQQRRSARQRLVIKPRRPSPHGCPLCPENLCKGEEVAAILASRKYRRVVYAGDGANDICPALALRQGDVVLARAGHALAAYAAAAARGEAAPLRASVLTWDNHEELAALVERFTAQGATCDPVLLD